MPKSGDTSPASTRGRLIHVRLDAQTHRRLRVAAAERDATIQDWVATAYRAEAGLPSRSEGPRRESF